MTLENEDGTYTISVKDNEMNMGDVISYLVIPVLRAAGYAESSIKEYIESY